MAAFVLTRAATATPQACTSLRKTTRSATSSATTRSSGLPPFHRLLVAIRASRWRLMDSLADSDGRGYPVGAAKLHTLWDDNAAGRMKHVCKNHEGELVEVAGEPRS